MSISVAEVTYSVMSSMDGCISTASAKSPSGLLHSMSEDDEEDYEKEIELEDVDEPGELDMDDAAGDEGLLLVRRFADWKSIGLCLCMLY